MKRSEEDIVVTRLGEPAGSGVLRPRRRAGPGRFARGESFSDAAERRRLWKHLVPLAKGAIALLLISYLLFTVNRSPVQVASMADTL